jgi:hypothetical protein
MTYCLMNYTVQCVDVDSGQKGCFLFDEKHWQETGKFKAISPVCVDLDAFFQWDKANGRRASASYLARV